MIVYPSVLVHLLVMCRHARLDSIIAFNGVKYLINVSITSKFDVGNIWRVQNLRRLGNAAINVTSQFATETDQKISQGRYRVIIVESEAAAIRFSFSHSH
jgi:hypothetical protein